jgi:hypothetical protein
VIYDVNFYGHNLDAAGNTLVISGWEYFDKFKQSRFQLRIFKYHPPTARWKLRTIAIDDPTPTNYGISTSVSLAGEWVYVTVSPNTKIPNPVGTLKSLRICEDGFGGLDCHGKEQRGGY